MPFGLQIVGRFRADRAVLGVAHALEQAFNGIAVLRRPIPDLAKLTKPTPELLSIVTHPPAEHFARAPRPGGPSRK
jgi:hypothetical protein